ncbi:hypothetical protein FGG08_000184 [Glutinoglossum americanum]|uniref:Uncharacterized protein n=1 Tax=Glutinoglossum americanum TaxID=1670608 RepID=A0A9P8L422_9PEZI|nr:hypothetical protein FGG08_000184 [Glutinoglossum americanum]
MLAIRPAKHSSEQKCTPNILPCRVNHNGPVNASERYWEPTFEDDRTRTAYFRGRKLRGKVVQVPAGYRGVVMSSTDKLLPPKNNCDKPPRDFAMLHDERSVDDDEQPEEIGIIEEQASFEEIVTWGHEALPDPSTDPYVKGVEEWVAFAEQINSFPPLPNGGQGEGVEGEGP